MEGESNFSLRRRGPWQTNEKKNRIQLENSLLLEGKKKQWKSNQDEAAVVAV